MKFIIEWINKHKEIVKTRNKSCDNYIMQIDYALYEIKERFANTKTFVDPIIEMEWSNHNSALMVNVSTQNIQKLKKAHRYKKLLSKQSELYQIANSLKQSIATHNEQVASQRVQYNKRPDLKMNFITAHKSKGLQADYIFIINNKKSRMGFPSKIQDASILNLLLDNCDQYPFAEERRLFYVALTRAKRKAYLITVEGQESVFAMELKSRYGEEIKKEKWTCPECGGRLVKRLGKSGEFWGCSNFRDYGCRYTRNIK